MIKNQSNTTDVNNMGIRMRFESIAIETFFCHLRKKEINNNNE